MSLRRYVYGNGLTEVAEQDDGAGSVVSLDGGHPSMCMLSDHETALRPGSGAAVVVVRVDDVDQLA